MPISLAFGHVCKSFYCLLIGRGRPSSVWFFLVCVPWLPLWKLRVGSLGPSCFSLFSALTAVGISIQRFLMEVKCNIPEASLSPQTLSPVLPKTEFLKNALYTKWTVSPKSPIYQPWSPETGRKWLEQLGIFWNFRFSSLDSGIELHCVFSIPRVFPIIVTLYCGSHLENLYTGTHCLSVLMDPVKYFLCKRESINVFQILQTRFCFVPSVWRFLYHL